MLSLNGNNTYTGPTTITGGTLAVNGSLASTVTVNSGGTIGGNGTLGGVMSNGGTLAPGNSIGTLTVSGNLAQNGGTYQVEANAAGQSDRINVGGTATIATAPRCRCWPSRATTAAAPPTPSCAPTAVSAVPIRV